MSFLTVGGRAFPKTAVPGKGTGIESQKPLARAEGLVVEALANEVLVYDLERDKAHCLNETAAWVWRHCDGNTSVAQMARLLGKETNLAVDERVIWFTLAQLEQRRLLKEHSIPPPMMAAMTRREMVRALAMSAVVAVPLITSIVAPTAVQASTCLPSGATCGTSAQCCSNACSIGHCI